MGFAMMRLPVEVRDTMESVAFPYDIPHLQQVGEWESVREAHEHALVILAAGIDCSVHSTPGGYALFTAAEDARDASLELELYTGEQVTEPPAEVIPHLDYHSAGIPWLLTWGAILAAVFSKQLTSPGLTDRFSNSAAELFGQGEWWRPFTSLFLHGDLPHLLGNILIGGIFCIMAAKSLGPRLSWPLILVGGTLGNLINAWFRRDTSFSSIGASTATFAALGLLVGLALAAETQRGRYLKLRSLAIPLIAGIVLFSMFGINGENTDVGGHLWGAIFGAIFGALAGWRHRKAQRPSAADTLALRCVPPEATRMS